jgi:hypothetical protein
MMDAVPLLRLAAAATQLVDRNGGNDSASRQSFRRPRENLRFGTTSTDEKLGDYGGGYEHLNEAFMCDYSLHSVQSRSAKARDNLVTTSFRGTTTRGFAAVDAPTVAVCLLPGTELAFENDVEWRRPFFGFFQKRKPRARLARFRQVDTEQATRHHDAVEFSNGQIVLLTDLRPGQRATVLQLPVAVEREDRPARGRATVIEGEPIPAHELDHT